ncbi:hypothetical protein BDZ91DRAFT_750680 [Kalaharituber pfeilii]|nr:hypothetical protein BDZ91DRAFT_750680 [Kalaharituber pfeilii]
MATGAEVQIITAAGGADIWHWRCCWAGRAWKFSIGKAESPECRGAGKGKRRRNTSGKHVGSGGRSGGGSGGEGAPGVEGGRQRPTSSDVVVDGTLEAYFFCIYSIYLFLFFPLLLMYLTSS